jgi:hypothetical protein
MKAIAKEPTIAAKAVAVNTAPAVIPSSRLNIPGLTAKMYDMVRKMVIPAKISVRTVVVFGSKPKSFCKVLMGKFDL